MKSTRLDIENLDKFSVTELIETAQQLEVGLLANDILPREWRNPGVAGLVAYQLIADRLENKDLSNLARKFLKEIETCSKKALSELETKGSAAFIKPIINTLMEYESGFQKKDYSGQELTELKKTIQEEKISMNGQLAYHKANKRFFIIVDDQYRQLLKGRIDAPKSWLGNAHCSLNDGMDISQSQKIFEEYEKEIGHATNPIFRVKDSKAEATMVYLNKTITFTIKDAAIGIPKTNSQMKQIHKINIVSTDLNEFKRRGIVCPYPDYQHHITIGEARREPHPALNRQMLLGEILDNESEISSRLRKILMPSLLSQVKASTEPAPQLMDGYGIKPYSGKVRLWSFNDSGSSSVEQIAEAPNQYQVYKR